MIASVLARNLDVISNQLVQPPVHSLVHHSTTPVSLLIRTQKRVEKLICSLAGETFN
jgi:hypothetical protein